CTFGLISCTGCWAKVMPQNSTVIKVAVNTRIFLVMLFPPAECADLARRVYHLCCSCTGTASPVYQKTRHCPEPERLEFRSELPLQGCLRQGAHPHRQLVHRLNQRPHRAVGHCG